MGWVLFVLIWSLLFTTFMWIVRLMDCIMESGCKEQPHD